VRLIASHSEISRLYGAPLSYLSIFVLVTHKAVLLFTSFFITQALKAGS